MNANIDPAAPTSGVDPNAKSAEVQALEAQLERQRGTIQELTTQVQTQNDPATAEPGTDVRDLLNQLVQAQAEYRGEIVALRSELAKARRPVPASTARALSAAELFALRMTEVQEHSHYCPGCGRLFDRPRECTGRLESPHPGIEVVPTTELHDPPDSSDKEAVAAYHEGHTGMQYSDPDVQARFEAAA